MWSLFDSDAGKWAVLALFALAVALVAFVSDLRRVKRRNPDAVGFMPWTSVFLAALFAAAVFAVFAANAWFAPV